VEVRIAGDFLFVNATRLRVELDNYASFSHILALFRASEIGVLHIHSGIERREWQIFLSLLLSITDQQSEERLEELQERLAAANVKHLDVERAQPEGETSQQQSRHAAKRVYSEGVAVTRDVIAGVRLGRATRLKRVKRAVQLVVDQVLNNEMSMVGMTTVRDYDEYTFTHSVNVCIFSVALGKKLGFSKVQLYDLGMTALLHDVGKARVPPEVLNKVGGLDEREWKMIQTHPWQGALTLFGMRQYEEIPYRSILVAHEHHMKIDLTGYPKCVRPRKLGIFSRIVAVADAFDAATTRRVYNTTPIEPDQVLREMWENPNRGHDRVVVKALINLIGIYPVGTCIILDTFEVAVVSAVNPDSSQLNRPLVRIAVDADGATVPLPGTQVNLAEKDESGAYRRSIVKVTNPDRFGLTVGDYFV
jgi:HD-GYP domain-containing protein (c-di-GMP phosphodiesterase class II)